MLVSTDGVVVSTSASLRQSDVAKPAGMTNIDNLVKACRYCTAVEKRMEENGIECLT